MELSIHVNDHKKMAYEKRINSLNEAKANRIGPSIEQNLFMQSGKKNPYDCKKVDAAFSQFYQKALLDRVIQARKRSGIGLHHVKLS